MKLTSYETDGLQILSAVLQDASPMASFAGQEPLSFTGHPVFMSLPLPVLSVPRLITTRINVMMLFLCVLLQEFELQVLPVGVQSTWGGFLRVVYALSLLGAWLSGFPAPLAAQTFPLVCSWHFVEHHLTVYVFVSGSLFCSAGPYVSLYQCIFFRLLSPYTVFRSQEV